MSMWVSASASTLEHTDLNGGAVYTSPNLTITINVLPKKMKKYRKKSMAGTLPVMQ